MFLVARNVHSYGTKIFKKKSINLKLDFDGMFEGNKSE